MNVGDSGLSGQWVGRGRSIPRQERHFPNAELAKRSNDSSGFRSCSITRSDHAQHLIVPGNQKGTLATFVGLP